MEKKKSLIAAACRLVSSALESCSLRMKIQWPNEHEAFVSTTGKNVY